MGLWCAEGAVMIGGNMEKIIAELEFESLRWNDVDYYGVVFVHPEDKSSLLETIYGNYDCAVNTQKHLVRFKNGGRLKVASLDRDHPHYDYAGAQLTTVIIDTNCFGKYEGGDFVKVSNVSSSEFIMYMMTRARSKADVYSRTVIL
ncbi:hypothetical protein [Vibrio phage VRU]|nr:hypothetical protein [Vibrio phage VRU]